MKRYAAFAIIVTSLSAGAFAQQPCATGQDLPRIPELISKDGKLKGTIVVVAETQNIGTRNPNTAPTPSATDQCFPQTVRAMKGINTDQPYPVVPKDGAADPMPGPTLRARVGELVELTFLNQIDMNRFPKSLDQGQCDTVTGLYPTSAAGTDTFPNCFHGSTTANVHFHGTHVNPDTTGDNVFVEIRPSLRTRNEANAPLVTQQSVKADFDEFFKRCEAELLPTTPLKEWPRTWADFPKHFTEKQELLLKQYDSTILGEKNRNLWLWPVDRKQRDTGKWPQYYVGAFPYCFRIPMYTATTFPPPANDTHAIHAQGKGSAESNHEDDRPLVMGQAPGTHWYHAHKHGSTTIDVSNGMVGAFIIEGRYDEELNAFYGNGWTRKQRVMVINQLGTSPNLERGGPGKGQDKGPSFSVNGSLRPVVHMRPGEVQMWRIVNSSSRAGAYIANFPTGFQWKQLAQDGVQFADKNYQASGTKPILLAAGNRADLLVMAPPDKTTTPVALQVQYEVDPSDLSTAALNTLLQISVDGDKVTGNQAKFIPAAPSFPPFLADIQDSEIKGTKRIVFASQPPKLGPQHTIDGKQFGGEVGAVVLLNQAEEWTVVNETYGPLISHPFHIHLNPFQITEVFNPNATVPDPSDPTKTLGKYVFSSADKKSDQQCVLDLADSSTWKECNIKKETNMIWWDVFPIPSGRTVKTSDGKTYNIPGYFKMRSRFVDYAGFYVLHCHILAHEDRGMMTIVEVAPLQSPYSHH
jgi:FtsP/CotA-like multicopper oxidase with cupredoxin domain